MEAIAVLSVTEFAGQAVQFVCPRWGWYSLRSQPLQNKELAEELYWPGGHCSQELPGAPKLPTLQ
jgi:hypothetical protein